MSLQMYQYGALLHLLAWRHRGHRAFSNVFGQLPQKKQSNLSTYTEIILQECR